LRSFDVAIIGGGLSGSSTALHLSKKGYSVIIFDKGLNRDFIPCAGGMASSVQKFLPIDINDALEAEVKKVHFTWKFSDKVIAELSGASPFWIISREILDNLLLKQAINYGAKFLKLTTVEKLDPENEYWSITCNNQNIYKSKFLVIADGSQSEWATYLKLGPSNPKFAKTIGIRLEGLGNIEKDSVRFDFGSVKYGFTWAFPSENHTNIGLGTFIGDYNINDSNLLNKTIKDFGFSNKKYEPIYKKLRIWNGIYKIHNERVLVVGDAASLCDPFLAEGIRPSLLSSFYAAKCIDKCLLQNTNDLSEYSKIMKIKWGESMVWGKRIAEVFYRFPKTGYNLGVKRKTAPQRIGQILSGEMSYSDIAKRVIRRLLLR
tara:strand:+ start:5809 stop:6933 length:1125 start_codon:yes stop_codon:yes gene_type:complete